MRTPSRLVGVLAVAALAFVACEPSEEEEPEHPDTWLWYGDIVAVETYGVHRKTEKDVGGYHVREVEDTTNVVTNHVHVTAQGIRTQTVKGSIHEFRDRSDANTEGTCPAYTRTVTTADGEAPERELVKAESKVLTPWYFRLHIEGNAYSSLESGVSTSDGRAHMPVVTVGHNEFSNCEGGRTDPFGSTIERSLESVHWFDHLKGTLGSDAKSAVGEATWRENDFTTKHLRWSLKRAKDLEAVVGGPYVVERGAKVELDGSRSHGDIEKYIWTVTPRGEDCVNRASVTNPDVGKRVEHEGKTFSFTALCSVDVELVVRGKNGAEDADHGGEAVVRPRTGWKTEYEAPVVDVVDDDPIYGGRNRCFYESYKLANHWIHRDGDGFTVKRVDDPEGPFAGVLYIDSASLKVKRHEVLEAAYMGPNGRFFMATDFPFDGQLESQIRKHESAHTTLVRDALAQATAEKRDAAQILEELASSDEGELRAAGINTIFEFESELCNASSHPRVFEKLKEFAGISGVIKDGSGGTVATVSDLQTFANDDFSCE